MTRLISQRGTLVTSDTAEALRSLEVAAAKVPGLKLHYGGVPASEASWEGVAQEQGPTGQPPAFSMRPTGREVYLRAELDSGDAFEALVVLWGLAVPLGFVPWNRYPLQSDGEEVFHYLGPWTSLVDYLHGEGRGEWAWPSLCAAAQIDVSKWEGPKAVEISLQAQLHRVGIHCGPVDGEIGPRTLSALRSLGLGTLPLPDACEALRGFSKPSEEPDERTAEGFFQAPALRKVQGFSSGKVYLNKTRGGWVVTSKGPGRCIFVVGE